MTPRARAATLGVEPLPAQPRVMGERPGGRVVNKPVAKQQLREPMPRPHQLATRVLASADQIACRLLVRLRHPHRHQLAQPQQPRQPLGIATIRLDPVSRRTRDLRRRRNHAHDPRRRTGTREPVAGRACFVRHPHRPRKLPQPLDRLRRQRRRPQTPKLTRRRVQHARDRLTRMHIQPHPRTLSHTGASRNCGSTAAPTATATRANLRARRRQLHTV